MTTVAAEKDATVAAAQLIERWIEQANGAGFPALAKLVAAAGVLMLDARRAGIDVGAALYSDPED